mmetsp:Transcript_28954/g.72686  ORF Transcript_28954/g.72686 Transcript_28954/m.72686 type:complete len:243 (+) Transcript_28954:61-789(+)
MKRMPKTIDLYIILHDLNCFASGPQAREHPLSRVEQARHASQGAPGEADRLWGRDVRERPSLRGGLHAAVPPARGDARHALGLPGRPVERGVHPGRAVHRARALRHARRGGAPRADGARARRHPPPHGARGERAGAAPLVRAGRAELAAGRAKPQVRAARARCGPAQGRPHARPAMDVRARRVPLAAAPAARVPARAAHNRARGATTPVHENGHPAGHVLTSDISRHVHYFSTLFSCDSGLT